MYKNRTIQSLNKFYYTKTLKKCTETYSPWFSANISIPQLKSKNGVKIFFRVSEFMEIILLDIKLYLKYALHIGWFRNFAKQYF
jgi:hypothetical protein